MHQAGFTQAVASLGTAFTSGQANLLRRYADEVLLAYDSDGAGTKAALRAIGILKEVGLTGKVLHFDPYKDPDEFIKNLGPEEFQKRIDEAENSFLFEIRMLQRDYDLKDPESKTKFYREVAKKLCGFPEEIERNTYIHALDEIYHMGYEDMRKLVVSYAAQTGFASPVTRPKSGIQKKTDPEENAKVVQRRLITYLNDNPALYQKVKKYITIDDFTEPLYKTVVEKMFPALESGNFVAASMISEFPDEEEQKEVAALFNTSIQQIGDQEEESRAFHDTIYEVKKNSYEVAKSQTGSDINALSKVLEGKRLLDELSKTRITIS